MKKELSEVKPYDKSRDIPSNQLGFGVGYKPSEMAIIPTDGSQIIAENKQLRDIIEKEISFLQRGTISYSARAIRARELQAELTALKQARGMEG